MKKKLNLETLEVKSFVTDLADYKGGNVIGTGPWTITCLTTDPSYLGINCDEGTYPPGGQTNERSICCVGPP